MKKLLILILLFIISCGSDIDPVKLEKDKQARRDNEKYLAIFLYTADFISKTECKDDSYVNNLVDSNVNSQLFTSNANTKFTSAIIGDSTIYMSQLVDGFYNSVNTKSIAFGGNTLCGMIRQVQLNFISSANNPENIIVATMGGNDLVRNGDPTVVGQRGITLINLLVSKFPNAKIGFVGVHPVFIDYPNQAKNISNAIIATHIASLNNPKLCYIEPRTEIFNVSDPNGYPNRNDMGDGIHYKSNISLALRQRLISKCDLVF